MVAFDLPGHGRSGGEPLSSIPAYAEAVYHGVEALLASGRGRRPTPVGEQSGEEASAVGECPLVVAGHSMGGAIALEMALSRTGALAGLILVGTGARLRVLPSALEKMARGERDETLLEMAYAPGAPPELRQRGRVEFRSVPIQVLYRDYSACDRFDRMQEVASLRLPALIVVGAQDALTPTRYSQYLVDRLGGTLRVIPGAGHMVMLEKPAEVNQAMGDFLKSLRG